MQPSKLMPTFYPEQQVLDLFSLDGAEFRGAIAAKRAVVMHAQPSLAVSQRLRVYFRESLCRIIARLSTIRLRFLVRILICFMSCSVIVSPAAL